MLKRTAFTAGYYAISIILFFFLNGVSPSGPCNPGAGFLVFMIMIPVSIGLLCRNIYVTSKAGKENVAATLIHAVACVLMLSPFLFS
jgi:hypothetical protein